MRKFLNRFSFLILLLIFAFSLTGCSNVEENLENYYYVMAIGIDKGTDTKIKLSVQIATNSSGRTVEVKKVQNNLIHLISILFLVTVLTLELVF